MSGPRIDTTLPVPPAPGNVAVLQGLEGVLALPGPAGPGPFLVEAGVVRVEGRERGGIDSISIAGRTIITGFSTTAGTPANIVTTPGSIRRELIGPQGTTQETVFAPASQNAAAIQWRGATPHGQGLAVRFTIGAGATGIRFRTAEHALVVRADSEAGDHIVVIHPTPTSWTVVEAAGGGLAVAVETEMPADGAVTLAVVVAAEGRRAGLSILEHLDSHARRGQSTPWDEGGVRFATGVAELDEGMGWLAARLDSRHGSGSTSSADLLWWGLGALACGLQPAAERAFALLEDDDPCGAHTVLFAARIASVTGDQRSGQRVAGRLLAPEVRDVGPADRLAALAWRALADSLRYAASDEDLDALRRAASSPAPSPSRVTLPMAGAPLLASILPPWLTHLIEDAGAVPASSSPLAVAAAAIRGLSSDDLDAYTDWRGRIAAGLSAGPVGRGTWDSVEGAAAPVAGALVCGILHGLLGWDPDAPVGRLGLSPSFPGHLTAFAVHGLPVGDARVSMEYRREGSEHTYAFEPTQGRVPPTLVVEPRVVAEAVAAVYVDGQPAALNVARARDRATVSVQIPLDGPRTLRLTTVGGG